MKKQNEFGEILDTLLKRRWLITLIILVTFMIITMGIGFAITLGSNVNEQWKELLMLLLGAFIGSYGKIMDYWFQDNGKDKIVLDKIDEDNDSEEILKLKINKNDEVSE
jgi:hypothetical protein